MTRGVTVASAIRLLLAGPVTKADIGAHLGLSERSVKRVLADIRAAGFVVGSDDDINEAGRAMRRVYYIAGMLAEEEEL